MQVNGRPFRRGAFSRYERSRRRRSPPGDQRYLREHPDDLSEILGYNESFVFFAWCAGAWFDRRDSNARAFDATTYFFPGSLHTGANRSSTAKASYPDPLSFVVSRTRGIDGAGRVDAAAEAAALQRCGKPEEAELYFSEEEAGLVHGLRSVTE
jgi:hypothetical protein